VWNRSPGHFKVCDMGFTCLLVWWPDWIKAHTIWELLVRKRWLMCASEFALFRFTTAAENLLYVVACECRDNFLFACFCTFFYNHVPLYLKIKHLSKFNLSLSFFFKKKKTISVASGPNDRNAPPYSPVKGPNLLRPSPPAAAPIIRVLFICWKDLYCWRIDYLYFSITC